jgi:RNA polymerase sigma factor (sigma-70 family)
MSQAPTVFVIDDDEDVRSSLEWLLGKGDLEVETHASARSFLDNYRPERPGCVVLDVRMPEMNGLELQQRMIGMGWKIPVIIVSGHADVPIAVRAVQAGALDVIEKPYESKALLDKIHEALALDARRREADRAAEAFTERLSTLTPREREVLTEVVAGKSTKAIAEALTVSARTVEKHRERLMRKMEVRSTPELIAVAMSNGIKPEDGPAAEVQRQPEATG